MQHRSLELDVSEVLYIRPITAVCFKQDWTYIGFNEFHPNADRILDQMSRRFQEFGSACAFLLVSFCKR